MGPVLGLVADLFFSARIRETAKQLGAPCEIVATVAPFLARVREAKPALVLVDMNLRSGDALDAVRALRADPATKELTVVGYLHDIQESEMEAALAAGCSQVLSRGQLSRRLADLISKRERQA